jgi:hypothetical protein
LECEIPGASGVKSVRTALGAKATGKVWMGGDIRVA